MEWAQATTLTTKHTAFQDIVGPPVVRIPRGEFSFLAAIDHHRLTR